MLRLRVPEEIRPLFAAPDPVSVVIEMGGVLISPEVRAFLGSPHSDRCLGDQIAP